MADKHFLKSVGIMMTGTAASQVIAALATPVLTRIYSPDDFGLYGSFISILTILAVLATLKYELALPLEQDTAKRARLGHAVILFITIISILALVLFPLVQLLQHSRLVSWLGGYIWLLPAGLFSYALFELSLYWCAGEKSFGVQSGGKAFQSFVQVLMQGALGLAKAGAVGLAAGLLFSRFIASLLMLAKGTSVRTKPSLSAMRQSVAAHTAFPKFTMPAAFVGVLGQSAPAILFAEWFSAAVAGQYVLTLRVLMLPSAFMGAAVGQVFYPIASACRDDAVRVKALVEDVASSLFALSLPVFLFVAGSGGVLFQLLFGESWGEAGLYAALLTPWLLMQFVSSPLSTFVFIAGRQKTGLLFTSYETALRLAMLATGAYFASPELAIGLFSLAGCLITTVYFRWVLHLSGSSMGAWLKGQARVLGVNLGAFTVTILTKELAGDSAALLTGALLFVPIGVFALFRLLKRRG